MAFTPQSTETAPQDGPCHHVPLTSCATGAAPALLQGRATGQQRGDWSREQHPACAGLTGHAGSEGQPSQALTVLSLPFPCLWDANWLWAQLCVGLWEITILVHERTQTPGDFTKKLS